MNIFVTNFDPNLAARDMADIHVNKMAVESYQILCSALHLNGVDADLMPKTKSGNPPRPTHLHHPCVKWAAESIANCNWLARHGSSLCHEFNRRYGKSHFCEPAFRKLFVLAVTYLPDRPMSPFPLCMPDEFKGVSTVSSYRRYYFSKRLTMRMEWTSQRIPP